MLLIFCFKIRWNILPTPIHLLIHYTILIALYVNSSSKICKNVLEIWEHKVGLSFKYVSTCSKYVKPFDAPHVSKHYWSTLNITLHYCQIARLVISEAMNDNRTNLKCYHSISSSMFFIATMWYTHKRKNQ